LKLKQPTANSSSYNGPLEPCLGLEFDEVEDARICYNAYASEKDFSIRKNHTQLSKGDNKLLIGVDYSCSREGFRYKSYQKKIYINSRIYFGSLSAVRTLINQQHPSGRPSVSRSFEQFKVASVRT
jgi:hypothetical protein